MGWRGRIRTKDGCREVRGVVVYVCMERWMDGENKKGTKGGASEKEVEMIPERKAGAGKGQKRTTSIASPTTTNTHSLVIHFNLRSIS
jgi:hypothetical protein